MILQSTGNPIPNNPKVSLITIKIKSFGKVLDLLFYKLYRKVVWFQFASRYGWVFNSVEISVKCCGDSRVIQWQNGPTEDLICKCGKSYLVKWIKS